MPGRRWTPDEDALMRTLYPVMRSDAVAAKLGRTTIAVYGRAEKLGLSKSEAYLASPDACRLRRGEHVGAAYQFKRGQVPANKGLRRPGWAPGRMAETQFKPGVRQGRAAALYQPVGSTRISKDGYLERKINEQMPFQRRWRAEHILVWEAANGPLPPSHAVAFLPGRRTNDPALITLDALELITRAELMRRNSYHTRYPKEIGLAIQLRGALIRKINKRAKA